MKNMYTVPTYKLQHQIRYRQQCQFKSCLKRKSKINNIQNTKWSNFTILYIKEDPACLVSADPIKAIRPAVTV